LWNSLIELSTDFESAIKNDPNINSVKINDSEMLLSQYADDSSLVLEDDSKSVDNSIKLFHKFTESAGVRKYLLMPSI
jgi:hypothetical protein